MSIVLVSYEGHLMPLMDDISPRARAIEVITKENYGVSSYKAKQIEDTKLYEHM